MYDCSHINCKYTTFLTTIEGKYEKYLTDINNRLFQEQVWLHEAMGNSVDKLVKIDRVKNDLIRDGFDELPQTFSYLPSYKKIQNVIFNHEQGNNPKSKNNTTAAGRSVIRKSIMKVYYFY